MTGHPGSTVPTLPRKELREYYGNLCQGAGANSPVPPPSSRGRRHSRAGGNPPSEFGSPPSRGRRVAEGLDVRADFAQAWEYYRLGLI